MILGCSGTDSLIVSNALVAYIAMLSAAMVLIMQDTRLIPWGK